MSRARFQITKDYLADLLSLRANPLSTTLPKDIRIIELSQGEDEVCWILVESEEFFALDDEIPEIEAWYWGGTPKGV